MSNWGSAGAAGHTGPNSNKLCKCSSVREGIGEEMKLYFSVTL